MARLKKQFKEQVLPELMKELSYKNPHQVPNLRKVVVNVGLGDAIGNPGIMEDALNTLSQITGQKAVSTRAKQAISNFKVREGAAIGAKVTLSGIRMWEFFDRLVSLAIPRIRDFRGLSPKGMDGSGNYTFGIKEQIIFHEINHDKIKKIHGMDITIVTSAKTDKEGLALLKALGVPFRTHKKGN